MLSQKGAGGQKKQRTKKRGKKRRKEKKMEGSRRRRREQWTRVPPPVPRGTPRRQCGFRWSGWSCQQPGFCPSLPTSHTDKHHRGAWKDTCKSMCCFSFFMKPIAYLFVSEYFLRVPYIAGARRCRGHETHDIDAVSSPAFNTHRAPFKL